MAAFYIRRQNELYHHGIKGQKWNVRRYQNEDGSLTAAGRIRYGIGEKMRTDDPNDSAVTRRVKRDYNNLSDEEFAKKYQGTKEVYRKRVNRYGDPYMNAPLAKLGKKLAGVKGKKADKYARDEIKKVEASDIVKTNRQKKIAKIAAGTAVVAGAAIVAALIGNKIEEKQLTDKWNENVKRARESEAELRREFDEWDKQMKDSDKRLKDAKDKLYNSMTPEQRKKFNLNWNPYD